jgi:hypothetical protein
VDIVVVLGGILSRPAGQQARGGAHRTSCVGLLFLLCRISGMLFQIFGEVVSVRTLVLGRLRISPLCFLYRPDFFSGCIKWS